MNSTVDHAHMVFGGAGSCQSAGVKCIPFTRFAVYFTVNSCTHIKMTPNQTLKESYAML